MRRFFLVLICGLCGVLPASAQMLAGKVVADCAVGNPTAVATGSTIPLTVDVNGKLCTNATGGGGGGGDASAANQVTGNNTLTTISNEIGAISGSPTANTLQARLATINTTLGTPFQAGGSIGNTSFGISGSLPAFAATPTVNLGTLNGAATATNQTNASQKTQIVDGAGNVISSTANNLNVQCANCSGSGASAADAAAFTGGASVFAPSGGVFHTTPTTSPLTNGQQGEARLTANRAFHANLRNEAGTEIGTTAAPIIAASPANTNPQCIVSTSGTYASGDAFGFASGAAGSGPNPCELTSVFAATGGSAIEATVTLINYDNTAPYTGVVDVFITKADPNSNAWTANDNTAFVFGTVTNVVGGIHSCTMVQRSANRSTCQIETALPLVAAAGSSSLWCTTVIKGAFTANSGSVACIVYMKG